MLKNNFFNITTSKLISTILMTTPLMEEIDNSLDTNVNTFSNDLKLVFVFL